MVEDKEIKTKTSPFAIREGETKEFDGTDKYVSMDVIVNKINMGHIGDVHFKILELINEFEFMTSRQIFQMLQTFKIDIASQDKLNNKLEQLVKLRIIARYYFTSKEGKSVYKVYCLEKMGQLLLNSRNIECKWQPTDNLKPVPIIKKRLAGNQVLIAYLNKAKAFNSYTVKPHLKAKQTGKSFEATGGSIKLTIKDASADLLFEVVRREDNWERNLVLTMRLYNDFYQNFITNDGGFEKIPQLILICEDDKHMVETFKEIVKNSVEIPKIKLYFSTDLRQISDTLATSLVEFKLDDVTGKYKMEECDAKLLG